MKSLLFIFFLLALETNLYSQSAYEKEENNAINDVFLELYGSYKDGY